jgi:NTE family protein
MKVGIAFSGGGARGIAHIGIMKALNEFGIEPSIISGTSAGAIIGALYAYGYSPEEIFGIVQKTKLLRILRPAFTWTGLLTLEKTYKFFRSLLPTDSFDSLKIPLYICGTDVRKGRAFYFSTGSLIRSVMASSAIPVIFAPVEINGKHYIDGGITNNLPVEPLVGHTDKIIGLHCNPIDKKYDQGNMKDLLERTFIMAIYGNIENRVKTCDLFLEPYKLRNYGAFDFAKAKEIYEIGYSFAIKNEKQIKELLTNGDSDKMTIQN